MPRLTQPLEPENWTLVRIFGSPEMRIWIQRTVFDARFLEKKESTI